MGMKAIGTGTRVTERVPYPAVWFSKRRDYVPGVGGCIDGAIALLIDKIDFYVAGMSLQVYVSGDSAKPYITRLQTKINVSSTTALKIMSVLPLRGAFIVSSAFPPLTSNCGSTLGMKWA